MKDKTGKKKRTEKQGKEDSQTNILNKKKLEKEVFSPAEKFSTDNRKEGRKFQVPNFGRVFLGLFVVFLGLVLLGDTTGIYHVEIDFWSFWPVLIIAFGLSLLSRRGWLSFFIAVIVTLLVILLAGYAIFKGFSLKSSAVSQVESELISIPYRPGVKAALIKVKTGAGKLSIEGGGGGLISGRFNSNFLKLRTASAVRGGVQEVTLETFGSGSFFRRRPQNELDLSISSLVPVDLYLETGAMKMEMDLTEVKARTVEIKSGASSLRLALGELLDFSEVRIESGASSIDISLPSSMGARLEIKGALVSKSLPGFKEVAEGVYQSENYDKALKKAEISLDIGVSSLRVYQD